MSRERSKRFHGSLNSREKLNQGKFNQEKKKKETCILLRSFYFDNLSSTSLF